MEFNDAKQKYLNAWGMLGSSWGINRTMAQIHALLMIAPDPLCAEEVMSELNISRGNANMNLRALIDWGLVEKVLKPGERKEFFEAEKDIWVIARNVMEQRKKRELEPVIKVLEEVSKVEGPKDDPEIEEFRKSVSQLQKFTK